MRTVNPFSTNHRNKNLKRHSLYFENKAEKAECKVQRYEGERQECRITTNDKEYKISYCIQYLYNNYNGIKRLISLFFTHYV